MIPAMFRGLEVMGAGSRGRRRGRRPHGKYSIAEVAEKTGISASVLRIWELRYKWPDPERLPNGYRIYTQRHLDALLVIKVLLDSGKMISEVINDPQYGFSEGYVPNLFAKRKAPRKTIDLSGVPLPESDTGRRLRQRIEAAVAANDHAAIQQLQMEVVRLHPKERWQAVTGVVEAWRATS